MIKIFVSPCLRGYNVKYNGKNNLNANLMLLLKQFDVKIYSLCPEVSGGLNIPRDPCEIKDNDVINNKGISCKREYEQGAKNALKLCQDENIKIAILKENSPSCGSNYIYDGNFNNKLIPGLGITANLFKQNNIKVFNEKQLELIKDEIKKIEKLK